MPRSEIQTVTPKAIYKLSDLFAAVQREKAKLDSQLEGRAEWAQHWPPKATSDALGDIATKLEAWMNQGFTDLAAEAPFSDGQLTGAVENQMTLQFKDNRVRPVFAPKF